MVVTAFGPAKVSSRSSSSSLRMGYENELGVQAPVGFFDPLGNSFFLILSFNYDQLTILVIITIKRPF